MISPLSGERNLTMLTDLYQLTMANGYLQKGVSEKRAVFDLFYRGSGGYSYAVAAGLEQAVQYLRDLRFEEKDIAYLRSLGIFPENFLERLKTFRFTGDLTAVPEGTIVFPSEPILTVSAPIFEAQIIETALLTIVNHQTLIATTAARLAACTDAKILEFGLRRAQGPDAGTYGARAAYIGGCRSTSNVLAGEMFGIAVAGTHSHSWVMTFPTELEAFEAYAEIYPDNCLLLVDTYDTLKSGVPNAIKVFDRLKAEGHKPVGIRLDSGDLAYLSREARKMLDAAGHEDCKIFASNDIDERGVYKLCAVEEEGRMVPKIKVSDSHDKTTDPGIKKTVRIYRGGMAAADLICLADETVDTSRPLTVFHPEQTWKRTTFKDFTVKELPVEVIRDGELVYGLPTLEEIGRHHDESKAEFFPEYKRVVNTQYYKVDLSQKLWDLKQELLAESAQG